MSHRPPQVLERHLARRAVAYIRQSSPQQVLRNQGSAEVQRDTRDLLEHWGWPSDRIDVIDDDLGISGSNPGARQGFSTLITQMRAMQIGIVMVLDSSRLGRNHPDFAQFQDAARLFDVLYAIQTQVFDFNDPNGEFVSAILSANAVRENRARVDLTRRAKRKKAEAGLVPSAVPTGYVRSPDGSVHKHPDQNVRNVIELIVDLATQVGSGRALVRRLKNLSVSVPRRTSGVGIRWEPATWGNVSPFLRNPFYKGTYTFGKHAVDHTVPPYSSGRARRRLCAPEQVVTRENNHEPYAEPRAWATIQAMLHRNRSPLLAPPGKGDALVQGLVRCQAHNVGFHTRYGDRERLANGQVPSGGIVCLSNRPRARPKEATR